MAHRPTTAPRMGGNGRDGGSGTSPALQGGVASLPHSAGPAAGRRRALSPSHAAVKGMAAGHGTRRIVSARVEPGASNRPSLLQGGEAGLSTHDSEGEPSISCAPRSAALLKSMEHTALPGPAQPGKRFHPQFPNERRPKSACFPSHSKPSQGPKKFVRHDRVGAHEKTEVRPLRVVVYSVPFVCIIHELLYAVLSASACVHSVFEGWTQAWFHNISLFSLVRRRRSLLLL